MADHFNPYQAPAAPIVEDFIVVEPRRRSLGRFVTAAVCFGFAALLLILEIWIGWLLITYPPRQAEPPYFKLGLVFAMVTISSMIFLLAGRAFWRVRDRLGVILFLAGVAAFASIFVLPFLIP